MKLFISQPMAGKSDEEILKVRYKAFQEAKQILGEDVHLIKSFYPGSGRKALDTPLKAFAESIREMAYADVVYFAEGWQDARGCRLEQAIAVAYGIRIIVAPIENEN